MKYLLLSVLIVCGIFVSSTAHAQHEIHKKTGEILLVKIIEIGLDEIKYLDPIDASLVRSIDKEAVTKIVLEDREEQIRSGFDDPEFYAGQRTKAIKFNFFSPLTNYYIEAGFEKSISPGRSMDLNVGFIGVGKSPRSLHSFNSLYYGYGGSEYYITPDEESARGFFIRGGYKFINTPDFHIRGMRYSHILKGGYIKPEIQFGSFYYDEIQSEYGSSTTRTESRSETYGGLIINFGKQWVFSNVLLLDLSIGGGYGFSSNDDVSGQYSLIHTFSDGVGFSMRSSINLGILID